MTTPQNGGYGPPAYPQSPPAYPEQPPAYPPQPPAYPQSPPAYPQQPPAYPQAAAVPPQAPPPYPEQQPHPAYPAQPPAEHPAMSFHSGRVHLKQHQRGLDATALGGLALSVPNFLCSLLVVGLVGDILGNWFGPATTWVLVLLWLASGLLVFHRPTEGFIARYLLHMRYPTREELARLTPLWREVTTRAEVDGSTYELWIEDSDDVNAYAAAGHIVGVTRHSLNTLPERQLAAVLAHELGHHTGGHAWAGLLGLWYAAPGRVAWWAIRMLMIGLLYVMFEVSFAIGAFCILVVGVVLIALSLTMYGIPLIVLAAPYLLAAVGRQGELRADRKAAELGFSGDLVAMLSTLHRTEEQELAEENAKRRRMNKPPLREGLRDRLLSSHPDYHTRLRQLEAYMH